MPIADIFARFAPRKRFARTALTACTAMTALAAMTPVPANAYIIIPNVSVANVAIVNVSTKEQLTAALKAATRATEIRLAPGQYGDVDIKGINPAFDIVIRSADGSNRAEFDRLTMWSVSNIRLERINFNLVKREGEWDTTSGVSVRLGNNISFTRCNFLGNMNGTPDDDIISFRALESERIVLFNNYFAEARVAVSLRLTNRSSVFANRVRDVREGMNFEGVEYVKVERNYVSHVFPNVADGDHADAFQIFTGGSGKSSRDVLFQSNAGILDRGKAGFLIVGNQTSQRHQKIRALHNVAFTRMRQGIWIESTNSFTVDRNTLIAAPDWSLEPAIFFRNTVGGTVRGNVMPMLLLSGVTVTESNNLDLSDAVKPAGPTPQSQMSGNIGVNDPPLSAFTIKPGSEASAMVAGAKLSTGVGGFTGTDAAIEAQFQTVLAAVRALP